MRSALITGVNGQDGSYLAELLLERGYEVIGLVREDAGERLRSHPSSSQPASRSSRAVCWTTRCYDGCSKQYRPDEIYNFAARASSSQLLDRSHADRRVQRPRGRAAAGGNQGRRSLAFASARHPAARCSGRSSQSPQNELTPFRPRNPYGVAKLFAHGMVGTYRENFGVFGCSAILFNHESPRRGPEFVTRKITMGVARIRAGLARSLPLGRSRCYA